MLLKKRKGRSMLIVALLSIILLVGVFSLFMTAKNTYIITDGDETTVVESYSLDCEEAIKLAGITLGYHDSYTAKDTAKGAEIHISRADTITVHRPGMSTLLVTHGESVEEILEELDVTLDEYTHVNVPLDASCYDGMVVEVTDLTPPAQTMITLPLLHIDETLILREFGDAVAAESEPESKPESEPEHTASYDLTSSSAAPHDSSAETTSEDSNYLINTQHRPQYGHVTTINGETLYYTDMLRCSATAYTTENADNKITATGTVARVGAIAVDPTVIPYGSRMYIMSEYGSWVYGFAVAEDCGGGIKGNKIDLFFDTYNECIQFGVRDAIVYILPPDA